MVPALVTGVLTSLDVSYNNITGDGASQLSKAVLSTNTMEKFNSIPIKEMRTDSFTELNLSERYFGVEGGMVVAALLPVMASLTELDVSFNSLGSEGKDAIRKAVEGREGFALQL